MGFFLRVISFRGCLCIEEGSWRCLQNPPIQGEHSITLGGCQIFTAFCHTKIYNKLIFTKRVLGLTGVFSSCSKSDMTYGRRTRRLFLRRVLRCRRRKRTIGSEEGFFLVAVLDERGNAGRLEVLVEPVKEGRRGVSAEGGNGFVARNVPPAD